MKQGGTARRTGGAELAAMLLLLVSVLALLFHDVFRPDHTLFSNDGPLGRLVSECHQLPGRFTGCWGDLNWLGFNNGAAPPGIALGLQYLLKPVWFSKLYALLSLVLLGLGAWCFFFRLGLAPIACLLGGLAAALNSCFFSVACWGIAAHALVAALDFFALAALVDTTSRLRWGWVVLAGLAVGLGVVDGADVGAIFSLYVAAFILFQAWMGGGKPGQICFRGFSRLALVAVCAGFIAAQTISTLVQNSIVGVVGTGQDSETKQSHWDFATQWSLPPLETAALAVPGLFGYRMDSPDGGVYWGAVGRTPAVDRFIEQGRHGAVPKGLARFAGGGNYAGVLVLLVGFWALCQSLRRKASVFSPAQRRWLWFWLALAVGSLLLAFGRFAPFYRLLYALPYFSTIRNPVKFIYLVSFILVVIFAHGVDGLWRRYVRAAGPAVPPRWAGLRLAWSKAGEFEKFWLRGCLIFLGLVLLAWLTFNNNRSSLVSYLLTVGFTEANAPDIADFSVRQVGWFVLFFVLSAGLMVGLFSGAFAGARARWGGLALGLLLVADLGRADLPWVVIWNYQEKYASNPVIERLRQQPYEHRVTLLPGTVPTRLSYLAKLYRYEWLQQVFPFYNVQTLDIVDMPRVPEDYSAYTTTLQVSHFAGDLDPYFRYWALTSTDYVLGLADAPDTLNLDPALNGRSFRIVQRFDVLPRPGFTLADLPEHFTAQPDDHGPYALFQYTGALPRAKLFTRWQVNTNNQAMLAQLAAPGFDPWQTVLVAGPAPALPPPPAPAPAAGTVTYASYAPRDIVLQCDASAPSVLLLNDHYDPNWKVLVDGRPDTLLRCNFIMRGAQLPAGSHKVEFRFEPPYRLLYVSLSGIGIGLLLLLVILVVGRGEAPKP